MMDLKEIENAARQIVADTLGMKIEECLDESSFTEDLGADSLDAVDIIMATETKFDIALEEGEADKVNTIREYLDLVTNKVKHQ